jgi:hypothetical protein
MTSLPPPTTRPLFGDVPIEEAFAAQRAKALAGISALAPDVLLTGNLPRLRTELLETYRIHPLRLEWGARSAEPLTVEGRGRGALESMACVFVPFSGAPGLFDMAPTPRCGELPEALVRHDELVLVIPFGRADASRELDHQIGLIAKRVALINADVDGFNLELSTTLRERLASRARRARRNADLALELGPPRRPPRATKPDDRRTSRVWAVDTARPAGAKRRRGPGRPGWPDDLLADHYEEAVAATPEPRTLEAIAEHFRPLDGHDFGVSADHLRRLLTRIETGTE